MIRFVVHLKNQQRIFFDSNKSISQLQKNEKFRHTILTKYFDLNRIAKKIEKTNQNFKIDYKNVDKNFRNYLYQNFFTHFVWNKKKKFEQFEKKKTFALTKCISWILNLKKFFIFDCCWVIEKMSFFSRIFVLLMCKSKTRRQKSQNVDLWSTKKHV